MERLKYRGSILAGIFFVLLCSCSGEKSPEEIAKGYCDCLEKQMGYKNEILLARKHCDSVFIAKSRYFKLFKVDMDVKKVGEIPIETSDSTRRFMGRFMDYMNKNCKYGW